MSMISVCASPENKEFLHFTLLCNHQVSTTLVYCVKLQYNFWLITKGRQPQQTSIIQGNTTYPEEIVVLWKRLQAHFLSEGLTQRTLQPQIRISSPLSLPGHQLHAQRQLTGSPPLSSCCTACKDRVYIYIYIYDMYKLHTVTNNYNYQLIHQNYIRWMSYIILVYWLYIT